MPAPLKHANRVVAAFVRAAGAVRRETNANDVEKCAMPGHEKRAATESSSESIENGLASQSLRVLSCPADGVCP